MNDESDDVTPDAPLDGGSGTQADAVRGPSEDISVDVENGISIDKLYMELLAEGEDSAQGTVRLAPEQDAEVILDRVLRGLFDDSTIRIEESTVKEHLQEILLVLVAHRNADTNGKSLMGDLATLFDTRLSPGTVYPQLHELDEDGLLRVQELVRTKEYRIDDEDALQTRLTAAMEQHLIMGLFFRTALEELP